MQKYLCDVLNSGYDQKSSHTNCLNYYRVILVVHFGSTWVQSLRLNGHFWWVLLVEARAVPKKINPEFILLLRIFFTGFKPI